MRLFGWLSLHLTPAVRAFVLVMCGISAIPAAAQTIASADALFAKRAETPEGQQAVKDARSQYKQLLTSSRGDEYAHVVEQIGLLAFYEGLYLIPERDAAARASIFDECRKTAATLEGQAPYISEYLALRMGCTAQWMKYATSMERLFELSALRALFNQYIDDNLEIKPEFGADARYYGGSIYRVLSGIYANSLASFLRSALPNRVKAIEMAQRSIDAQPYREGDNPGSRYFGNHRYKAEALIANGQTSEAKALLDRQIKSIKLLKQSNRLPKGLEPETLGELNIMEALYASL